MASIGIPNPDCSDRRTADRARREARDRVASRHAGSATTVNGEETAFDLGYALNFHKGLPHDVCGMVHRPSYEAMVRMLSDQEYGAFETIAVGKNRHAGSDAPNSPRYTATTKEAETGKPLGYRKMVSPFSGHVFDTEGADAGIFTIGPAPLADSDELAAEMAELYVMALLRDMPFETLRAATGTGGGLTDTLITALAGMEWFTPTPPLMSMLPTESESRRFHLRQRITSGSDLFRGSTAGAKVGPMLSQFLLAGSTTSDRETNYFTFVTPAGTPAPNDPPTSSFAPGRRAEFGREDGFVKFGTQIVDQRSVVADAGIDYLTDWASWLDAQNGVDFAGIDRMERDRRFLTTPRDLATYVHFDALYQAYLVACLLMLGDGGHFPFDRGLPETGSRTRASFASFGGPHVLSSVTEVATRALKAVWRQKWLYHRRARPEAVAALLTLKAEDDANPGGTPKIANEELGATLHALLGKIPAPILQAVAAHNTAQNAATGRPITPLATLPADFPQIDSTRNYLLPMAFPEGSPTHPAYGAGHATVAGACVTVLKAFFEMYDAGGKERAWPLPLLVPDANGLRLEQVTDGSSVTVQGELDKLASNIAIGRNMAGVHYSTDYFESLRLGERVAVSILVDQLSLYNEPVSMTFKSFDADRIRISSNGNEASLRISVNGSNGHPSELIAAELWYDRYAS